MTDPSTDPDLLFGAAAIAKWFGVKRRSVYYWHKKKMMPIAKVGKTLVASKRKLHRAYDKLTT